MNKSEALLREHVRWKQTKKFKYTVRLPLYDVTTEHVLSFGKVISERITGTLRVGSVADSGLGGSWVSVEILSLPEQKHGRPGLL